MFIFFVLKSLLNLGYTLKDCLFLHGVDDTTGSDEFRRDVFDRCGRGKRGIMRSARHVPTTVYTSKIGACCNRVDTIKQ